MISGFWKSPKACGELGASESSQVNEFNLSYGIFRQVHSRQARRQGQSLPLKAEEQRDSEIWKAPTPQKPGCKGREQRVVGSEKKGGEKKAGGGGSNRKVEEREGKKKALGSRVPRGLSLQHLGRGSETKLRLQVRSALGVFAEGALLGSQSGLGMPGTPAPRARTRAPLTFARAARTHFRGLRGWGRGAELGALERVTEVRT